MLNVKLVKYATVWSRSLERLLVVVENDPTFWDSVLNINITWSNTIRRYEVNSFIVIRDSPKSRYNLSSSNIIVCCDFTRRGATCTIRSCGNQPQQCPPVLTRYFPAVLIGLRVASSFVSPNFALRMAVSFSIDLWSDISAALSASVYDVTTIYRILQYGLSQINS